MARLLRIQFENAYYHVTCRGKARQNIYSSDADRSAFLDYLGRSADGVNIGRDIVSGLVFQHFLFYMNREPADGCVMIVQVIRDLL